MDDARPATPGAGRPRVSVAIVHYETPELLVGCLTALRESEAPDDLEVFVVDNASCAFDPAAAAAAFPGATIIRNSANVGFARAANQALRLAGGRYLLLLNPDAFVAPESIVLMASYLDDHPGVGCVTCRVELEDGSLDVACRRLFPTPARSVYRFTWLSRLFPRSRRFGQYNLTYLDEWHEAEIDQPCGAFMLVRSRVRDEVGLLDERYFMYFEDTDWAFRMKQAGWRIMYVPTTTVRHLKRASSRNHRQATIRHFHRSMRMFYREHYEADHSSAVNATILLATLARERAELTADSLLRLRGRLAGLLQRSQ